MITFLCQKPEFSAMSFELRGEQQKLQHQVGHAVPRFVHGKLEWKTTS